MEARDKVAQTQKELEQTQKELEQARASAAAQAAQIQKSEKEKSELKAKILLQAADIARYQRRIEKQNQQIESLQKQLKEAETRWKKDLAKLGKWSDRLLQDYQGILKSNRWRIGCWLSLKRADEKSTEAKRLAELIASRPRPVSVERDVAPVRVSTGKGKRDGLTTMPPEVRRLTPLLTTQPQLTGSNRKRQPTSRKMSVPGKADVIVCVHNALEDVRRCLASIVEHRSPQLNMLILVNDGSDAQTASYLRQFAEDHVETLLLENPQPSGYTKAANRGLAAGEAEYAILLNSDTIVTPGWIDRLIACGESDPSIGIIGPLSNAASWQSVPERYSAKGDWAVNELPPWSSLDRVSRIFSILHAPRYPRVPLVNGFCFAIKGTVIDAIGLLDEELFPNGYGEENDYCLRAGRAGFSAAIADDCYLFHAKSRSYSHETRHKLARQSQLILRQKYGADLNKAI